MGAGASASSGGDSLGTNLSVDFSKSDDEVAAAIRPYYLQDPERFADIINAVKTATRSERPRFPNGVKVAEVPAENLEELQKTHVSTEYLDKKHPDTANEAKARLKKTRQLQYTRWKWAVDNVKTYINVLRAAGHPDVSIQNMFDGTPLCFPSPEAYSELRKGLKELAPAIEKEMGWNGCGFIITGSSVPGFSQNPCKGHAELPSKITDPAKSDVDICIVADGVNATVAENSAADENAEPRKHFPTTCSPYLTGVRFGCKDLSAFCKCAAEFHAEWSKKLPGGLQFTFAEDDNDTPPWEARIPLEDLQQPAEPTSAAEEKK